MIEKKYQVFVSSTYTDLVKERESIIKAVLEMYHIPIGMEMFSAEDEDQWEIIRRTIEISDYYILILGLRYGSKTNDNVSFTQKEYEYALEKNIPILAFILDDSVSLSKDRRDDNLEDINTFRNMVLKNSKMAQFWKTIDELTKNVSISLMKQIMQKPSIGWVRGDKAISEELSQELSILSKENRELRVLVKDLKLKIKEKNPIIEILIDPLTVDSKFDYLKTEKLPENIIINNINKNLKDYIKDEDIERYNNDIPSQEEIERYNEKHNIFNKKENYSLDLMLKICNKGTVKSNNLYIDIKFPDSFIIIDKYTNEENNEPKNPIPFNPIKRAQRKYEEHLEKSKHPEVKNKSINIGSLLFDKPHNGTGIILQPQFKIPKIRPATQSWWTSQDGNTITIKINSLLHTRCINFNDEYTIVPLRTGKHNVEVSVICEEFETKKVQTIELYVLK